MSMISMILVYLYTPLPSSHAQIKHFPAFAYGMASYRDAMGRNQDSSSTSGNSTTYRDTQGRLQGTNK